MCKFWMIFLRRQHAMSCCDISMRAARSSPMIKLKSQAGDEGHVGTVTRVSVSIYEA